MAFLTYENVRPWAKAIKAAVATRKMPPWFADPKYGHFSTDRALKQADIDTLVFSPATPDALPLWQSYDFAL